MKDPAALSKAAWSLFPSSKERNVNAGATALAEESAESPARRRLNELIIIISKKWRWKYGVWCTGVLMVW